MANPFFNQQPQMPNIGTANIMQTASRAAQILRGMSNPQQSVIAAARQSGLLQGYSGPEDPEQMVNYICQKNGLAGLFKK